MMIFTEPLLIASAPGHVLTGLGLFFAVAAIALFCLAVEQGTYPGWRYWLSGLHRRLSQRRQMRRRWVRYALFGGVQVAFPA